MSRMKMAFFACERCDVSLAEYIMSKRLQHSTPRKQKIKKNLSSFMTINERIAHANELEDAFASFPDAIILCDQEGKILRINAAALKLFEWSSEQSCRGIPYQQFLHHYAFHDEQQKRISLDPWLLSVVLDEKALPNVHEQILLLEVPSGRKIYLNLYCSPLLNTQQHTVGVISVFHEITSRYQKVLYLKRVHEAVSTLTETIVQIPEHVDLTVQEEIFLLSPSVSFIAQQLVEVLRQTLDCHQMLLVAFEPPAGHLYYIASSGFTTEQEQQLRESRGRFLLSDIVDETMIARLQENQVVILPTHRLRLPDWYQSGLGTENHLLLPLFLEQQWVGTLSIARASSQSEYTEDEIELIKTVVAYAVLILECIHALYEQTETKSQEPMLYEAAYLSNNFLTLAAHELRTPLTWIKGNLQLAQRRLQTLKCQIVEQSEQIAHVQNSLVAATQGTRLQERMIQDLLDDACIQAHKLELSLKQCDLLTLVKEAVATQRRAQPTRTILLENPHIKIPIIADADRVTRVINRYIENALTSSSGAQVVRVHVEVENAIAWVSVHNEGLAIPIGEQERIWERSYRAQGSAVQHVLDLSLGLGLYLCRMFIECHHGSVGVQSDPGRGTTFWFTLPLALSPEK